MTDPARWLSAEIPEWRQLDRREKRSIRDLPILWALFELHATGQNGRAPNAGPRQICDAVAQLADTPELGREVKSARAHFALRYFHMGRPTQALQHLSIAQAYRDRVSHGLLSEVADEKQVFTALLLVVNRLRNNFLHGEKARYGFRNQYENFRHANNVLVAALEIWLRPY